MPDPGDTRKLCLSCGLCCDGALFSSVLLKPTDPRRPLVLAGVSTSIRDPQARFGQPCPALTGRLCSIYPQRPSCCRKFSCKLLYAVKRRTTTLRDAAAIVDQAHVLRDEVRRLAGEAGLAPFGPVRSILRQAWTAASEAGPLPQNSAALIAALALTHYLHTHFLDEPAAQANGEQSPGSARSTGPQ